MTSVEPISILRPENQEKPVFHLAFDVVTKQAESNNASQDVEAAANEGFVDDEELEQFEVGDSTAPSRGFVRDIVLEVNKRLETIAETGARKGTIAHSDWFAKTRNEMYGAGLTSLARILEPLSRPGSPAASSVLLKARFLTYLYSQAASRAS